jgi:hypothetical protein
VAEDEQFKLKLAESALIFVEAHFRYNLPYEVFRMLLPKLARDGQPMGSYLITCSRVDINREEENEFGG